MENTPEPFQISDEKQKLFNERHEYFINIENQNKKNIQDFLKTTVGLLNYIFRRPFCNTYLNNNAR